MVSTQEREATWMIFNRWLQAWRKKGLYKKLFFVKEVKSFFFAMEILFLYYFWVYNHFFIYLWAFIRSVNDASFLQIALVNLCRSVIDHHHWAGCTEVWLNLWKNALDLRKFSKSFILSTISLYTFFYIAHFWFM